MSEDNQLTNVIPLHVGPVPPGFTLSAVTMMVTEEEVTDTLLALSTCRYGIDDPVASVVKKLREVRKLFLNDKVDQILREMEQVEPQPKPGPH